MGDDLANAEKIGELKGALAAEIAQRVAYQQSTDARFLRIEDKIDDGFRQGQVDREAGNRTLGSMIDGVEAQVAAINQNLATGKGRNELSVGIINGLLTLSGGCLVGAIAHFFR